MEKESHLGELGYSSHTGQPQISNDNILIDRDIDAFETILIKFEPYESRNIVCNRFRDLHDYLHKWESNLGKFIIPQNYCFLKFVGSCVKNYLPKTKVVVFDVGEYAHINNSSYYSNHGVLNQPKEGYFVKIIINYL